MSATARLAKLVKSPEMVAPTIRSIRVQLVAQNAHYGARYFVKEELPTLAYNNPNMAVEILRKKLKAPFTSEQFFTPFMDVELTDGSKERLDLHLKHSTDIRRELLALASRIKSPVPTIVIESVTADELKPSKT